MLQRRTHQKGSNCFIAMSRLLLKNKKGKKGKGKGSESDQAIINSHASSSPGFDQRCYSDALIKPPSIGLTQRPPKDYQNMILWIDDTCETSVNWSAGGTVYYGYQFALSNFYKASAEVTNWDQFCIYSVVCRFIHEIPNSASTPGEFGSAIDFDSSTVPTGFGQIENYNSFQLEAITQGISQTRYVKPCVTPFVYQSGTSLGNFTVARQWVDSANPTVPHFGIKFAAHGNTSAFTTRMIMTGVFGFKNSL